MTREEIIDRLKAISRHAVHTYGEEPFVMSLDDGIAVCEAIEALKQEPCNDCISRKSVKAKMFDLPKPKSNKSYWNGADDVGDIVDALPSVQPRRKGKWQKERPNQKCGYVFVCSICGGRAHQILGNQARSRTIPKPCSYKYCPNCGAKMEIEDE